MKKSIVLCADDYGQAPEISQGIINLLGKGRLSATSCMVNSVYWPEHAGWLLPFLQQIDIGLHFNLTEGRALSKDNEEFPPLSKVIRQAFMHSLSQSAIEAELHAQIDKFQQTLGFLPGYIDGHQHIHQFPVIREAVIHVYEQRLRGHNAYIRLSNEAFRPRDIMTKKLIIAAGTLRMKKLLKIKQIPHNQSFAGIYSFSGNYPAHFQGFLKTIGDKGLVMCHPGLAALDSKDSIAKARLAEYQYFASDQFLEDCRAQEVLIKRFK